MLNFEGDGVTRALVAALVHAYSETQILAGMRKQALLAQALEKAMVTRREALLACGPCWPMSWCEHLLAALGATCSAELIDLRESWARTRPQHEGMHLAWMHLELVDRVSPRVAQTWLLGLEIVASYWSRSLAGMTSCVRASLVPAGLLDHNCEVLWKAKTRQRMLDFEFVTKDHGLGGGQWQASGFGFPVFGHLGRLELSRLLGFAVHVS